MTLPLILFTLFGALSAVGCYLIVAHFRSRRLAVLLAVGVLAFFAALALAVDALMRGSGLA